jgi:hypothetical protein
MPTGVRKQVADDALAAFAGEPVEYVRDRFKPHLDTYIAAIVNGVSESDRTCLHLFAKAMKLAGEETNVAVMLLTRHGLESEGQLERMLSRAREAEGVDEAQLWRLAEAFAMDYRRRKGLPLLIEGRPVEGRS